MAPGFPHSPLLLILPLFFFFFAISAQKHEDPTIKTMEEFSGYPIHEPQSSSLPSLSVDVESLQQQIDELSGFSDTPAPLVDRILYSETDVLARRYANKLIGSDDSTSENLKTKLLKAHAVVVTNACDNPPTCERVTDFWLPEIKSVCLQHKRKMGVIVVGCRQDLKTQFEDPHYSWHLLMDIQFPQMVNVYLERSTKLETRRACYIFSCYAQKARLQPVATLRDPIKHMLTHQAGRALLRIIFPNRHHKQRLP